LLADESIDKMRKLGLTLNPGAFAENLTTQGIELVTIPIGTKVKVGKEVCWRYHRSARFVIQAVLFPSRLGLA